MSLVLIAEDGRRYGAKDLRDIREFIELGGYGVLPKGFACVSTLEARLATLEGLLAEVIRGEPEAYETTFYPDRHGPNMTEWVERVRKELGQ